MELWNQIAVELREILPQQSYKEWIAPCAPVGLEGDVLTIQTGNDAIKMWLEQQYEDEFLEALQGAGLTHLQLRFIK